MSSFREPAMLTLETLEDTRNALENPDCWWKDSGGRYRVKSLWLMAIIDEYAATGKYPYNADVQRIAEERLGYPHGPDAGTPMSALIYNAQCYRHDRNLRAAGFVPANSEVLAEAFARKVQLETPGGTLYNVRKVDGKLYAMQPRKRKWVMSLQGQPVRLATADRREYQTAPLINVKVS